MVTNNLKTIISLGFIICSLGVLKAQFPNKYWVKFKDKNGSPYSVSSPNAFLSAKSITRRTNQGITVDITDIPVNQTYINQVNATGAQVFQRSKWMNAAIVIVNDNTQLTAINSLTCVLNSSPVGRFYKTKTDEITEENNTFRTSQTTAYNYGPSFTQVSQIGVDCMHENGYRGQNITIGVLDSGFDNVNNNAVFDSLRNEGRILGTRDIVAGDNSVYEDHNHGAMVLSTIVGNAPGQLIGTGPKSKVYLIRTEDVFSEKLIEEANWIVGAEYADSVGVDIMTTSLGYTTFDNSSYDHTYADLDGKTAMMSIAATMAARKGIFVLNAAGNEGGGSWNYVGVPADADSICTVGAVDGSGNHASFSSVGPTSDGRIKPDVSTLGQGSYVCSPSGNFFAGNGTSFATPIMAGAVACLWQANPTKTNMELLQAIRMTSSKSSNPDNNYGWGIPNLCAAHNYLNGTVLGVFEVSETPILMPNPVYGEIKFSINQMVQSVEVIDLLGKKISTEFVQNGTYQYTVKPKHTIVNGLYFLIVNTPAGIYKTKFLKQ